MGLGAIGRWRNGYYDLGYFWGDLLFRGIVKCDSWREMLGEGVFYF